MSVEKKAPKYNPLLQELLVPDSAVYLNGLCRGSSCSYLNTQIFTIPSTITGIKIPELFSKNPQFFVHDCSS